MFFKKNIKEKEIIFLPKIAALLIHAAKIDENYSKKEKNIIETLKEAKARKIFSLGFLGNGGGEALSYCDLAFVVPSTITARIQECHITAGHALLQYIEDSLLEKGWLTRE